MYQDIFTIRIRSAGIEDDSTRFNRQITPIVNYVVGKSLIRNLMILLLLTFAVYTVLPQSVDAGTAIVYVDPPLVVGLSVGDTFQVNVTVADVADLYAWSFQFCYKSEILNASSWTLAPAFSLRAPDVVNLVVIWTDNYNGTHGFIQIDCSLIGAVPTFSGATPLATVYFKLKYYGSTVLHLQNTMLLDDSVPIPHEIPHATADGTVRAGLSDVAVTKMTLSKNFVNDTVVWIDIMVANYGGQYETFNVTLYYGSTEINTRTVKDLAPLTMLNLNFSWDTTPVSKGNYTITAKAHPLPGEANTDDNMLIGGWIMETIRGDVTGDFKVDLKDIYQFARSFGSVLGNPRWNANCDLNNDGQVNLSDVFYAARNYGKQI